MREAAVSDVDVFVRRESQVRSYCRSFPAVFRSARGAVLIAEDGSEYLDFLCVAGAANYGHNDPVLKDAVLRYLAEDGVLASLDLHTVAKRAFLEAFERLILKPRGLPHRVQFTGPTGTNAVEAALKAARKATGRSTILAFTNGYHGMSLGALAATGNAQARRGAGVPLAHTVFARFDGYGEGDSLALLERQLDDPSGGIDLPAAAIVETVQGEGGCNAASWRWLERLAYLLHTRGILLIIDDVQAGCGRTGTFFSFERAGIAPDLIVLSKSIGGLGLPMSLLLLRPELDLWQPGEHNGTFRGNNLAFVAARAAIERYWTDGAFAQGVQARGDIIRARIERMAARHRGLSYTGRGLLAGLRCSDPARAEAISRLAYRRRLIIERCGPHDEVVKTMPPLNIPIEQLHEGLDRLERTVDETMP
ncbi:MAG: diaminobutyrate--2-oxoglutarate transaminase [Planctomycetes bacterium]|nr:diaminobutyrate--2-oxoglutarate transaminase [Planctomycetota bacterium]